MIADLHLLVQPTLLRQITDAVVCGAVRFLAQDANLPGVGKKDPHDHPQRRRLAGTIRADEAVDRSLRHRQRQIVDRGEVAERLRDVFDFDDVHTQTTCSPQLDRPRRWLRPASRWLAANGLWSTRYRVLSTAHCPLPTAHCPCFGRCKVDAFDQLVVRARFGIDVAGDGGHRLNHVVVL